MFSVLRIALLLLGVAALCAAAPFEIRVVDAETGRGLPLAELETTDKVRFVTDSAGRIAIDEPAWQNRTVFFATRSHGYEFPKDGFGITGVRVKVIAGGREVIQAKRKNLAERLYRLTGAGIYRDSLLLGHGAPIEHPLVNAEVAGQDSIQRVIFGGRVHWFWGDTTPVSYPLGNFRMSGAVSDLPGRGGLSPEVGINYRYFTNSDGFAKGMFPLEPPGELIWADGFLVLTNTAGKEQMIAHWQRLKGLTEPLGRGLAIYNKEREVFELLQNLPLEGHWQHPHGHPVRAGDFFLFGLSFPNVRAAAKLAAITNASAYEAWSCLPDGVAAKEAKKVVPYRWTRHAAPTGAKEEKDLAASGALRPEEAYFQPRDVETGRVVQMHSGTVNWNEWRKKWVLISSEIGGSSMLGEIWYSEADAPTGPWKRARKVVTHDKYSFYNPAHHPFFDQEGGRVIYFEGTYTAEFSGNQNPTPRYDYNQIMYRLDLARVKLGEVTDGTATSGSSTPR